jgi:hypothetical protein
LAYTLKCVPEVAQWPTFARSSETAKPVTAALARNAQQEN